MSSLTIVEEKLLTNEYSSKGKIFIHNDVIYSLYSQFDKTIKIYNQTNNMTYNIHSGTDVAIYGFFLDNHRLWFCGKNIDLDIGFYAYSDFSNGQFQAIQPSNWTDVSSTLYISQIFIIEQVLHFIKISKMNNQYYITMCISTTDYLIYTDAYCTFKDMYYDGNLYLFIETVDETVHLTYIKIFKQSNYSPTTGMSNPIDTNLQDSTLNVMYFDVCVISNVKYMIFSKSPFLNLSTNMVIPNQLCLYNLTNQTIPSSYMFPNIYFQSVTHIYLNMKNAFVGFLYQNGYDILKYFFIPLYSNGNIINNTVYVKSSIYNYISNDSDVNYVIKDEDYYLLFEAKNTLSQEKSYVVQSRLNFKINPHASIGSDPHVYPLFSNAFDMLQISTKNWYTLFEMDSLKIKSKFVGLRKGIFFHKVMIQNKDKNIEINFNKKKIKNSEHKESGKLSLKYKNITSQKSKGDYIDSKKLNILEFNQLKYPLSLYVDLNTRYLHFYFEDRIPSITECSGLIV
jgi:hypothetical protein